MDLASLTELEPAALLHELSRRVSANPSILDIKRANKWLEQNAARIGNSRQLRVAVLSEQTLEGLREPLSLFARLAGFDLDLFVCPPYFPEMQLIAPTSELSAFRPDIVVVILDLEKRSAFTTITPDESAIAEFTKRIEDTVGMMARFSRRTGAKIAATNFTPIWPSLSSVRETDPKAGRATFVQLANDLLHARCAAAGVAVLPLHSHLAAWGYRRCIDLREYSNTDTAFTPEGFNRIAGLVVAHLSEQFRAPRTLLIVDPEGALWGGSLDEAAYSPDHYPGRIFHRAMTWMKELAATGVRLALVGGGNRDRVIELLQRDDFLLHPEAFAAIVANDETVETNVSRTLIDLAVSPEQAVFLSARDDHCDRARRTGVTAVTVPDNLGDYLVTLSNLRT